jgi:uncharacterized protein (DUF924 family)
VDEANQVREFWFGSLPLTAATYAERSTSLWFSGVGEPAQARTARDEELRARFGSLVERAGRGELDSWAASPRRRLSLIILLDQFPRSIYRGTRRAFAHDEQALMLAMTGVQSGADAALDPVERMFFYMPLQHAESLDAQDESVAAFRRLVGEAPEELRPQFEEALEFAVQHRDIIVRFGRFPHRNRVMGRVSTAEERAFIARGADTFGQ